MRTCVIAAMAAVAALSGPDLAEARDRIVVGGSGTLAPYAEAVAAEFAKSGHPAPEHRPTEIGSDLQSLCAGVGSEFPDLAGTIAEMGDEDREYCRANGIDGLVEIEIGRGAIVVVGEGEYAAAFSTLTSRHLWLATAAQVPVNGTLVPNPYELWSEIAPSLPAAPIEILMPPDESSLEENFDELLVGPACESDPLVRTLDDGQQEEICDEHRQDDAVVEVANSAEIPEILDEVEHAVAIMPHQAYVTRTADGDNDDAMFPIDGVAPTPATVADGSYKGGRPVYLYVKTAHLNAVAGLKDYVVEFVSEKAIGENGYLAALGLVPLPEDARKAAQAAAAALAATN
jgi:phosphate transport system substrate-binding protein